MESEDFRVFFFPNYRRFGDSYRTALFTLTKLDPEIKRRATDVLKKFIELHHVEGADRLLEHP